MASAVIVLGGASTGSIVSLQSEPLDTRPVLRFLVEAGSIQTGDPDASAKSYAEWIAGRPAREEAKREAAQRARQSRISYSGSIPASVINCESGGSYTAENPTSSASGKYQIVDGTWNGFGGYTHASDAPPHVQDAKAAELWDNGRGAHHWRECL